MADLNVARSSDRTAEVVRLFHCTIAKGKNEHLYVIVCCCLNLNKMVWVCCSGHSDLSVDVRR